MVTEYIDFYCVINGQSSSFLILPGNPSLTLLREKFSYEEKRSKV